jgi:hypothetical protein
MGGIASAACMIWLSKYMSTVPMMLLMLSLASWRGESGVLSQAFSRQNGGQRNAFHSDDELRRHTITPIL